MAGLGMASVTVVATGDPGDAGDPGDPGDPGGLAAFATEQALTRVDDRAQVSAEHFALAIEAGCVALFPPAARPDLGSLPLIIDFTERAYARPLARKDTLARATGWKGGYRPPVVDLTAGLGRDAWALAGGGCRVTAVERHPVVHRLLADALARAAARPALASVAERITLLGGDVLSDRPPALPVSAETVWYLDPMFPLRKKSSLVKKPMRLFHHLVGDDTDATELFAWARRQAGARWVVKRPPDAPTIDEARPGVEYRSGRLRFDAYLPR